MGGGRKSGLCIYKLVSLLCKWAARVRAVGISRKSGFSRWRSCLVSGGASGIGQPRAARLESVNEHPGLVSLNGHCEEN